MRFESKSVDDHFRACLILASVNDIELADHSCDLQLVMMIAITVGAWFTLGCVWIQIIEECKVVNGITLDGLLPSEALLRQSTTIDLVQAEQQ